jgi:tetratricopeptide (TPR) repeat protein
MMLKKIPLFLMLIIMTSALWSLVCYGADEVSTGIPDEAYHNSKGLKYFKKGFYDLAPHKRKEEAAHQYGLAIQEFKKALAINSDYAPAHQNLGRVYSVQGKFLKAAKHYKKLTDLAPNDIDSYVLAALAYAEAGKYEDARAQLEIAKTMTTDKAILKKLDDYIKKLDQKE